MKSLHLTFILISIILFLEQPVLSQGIATEIDNGQMDFISSDNQQPFPFNFKDWWTVGNGFNEDFEIWNTVFTSDLFIVRTDFRIDRNSGDVSIGTLDSDTDLHIAQTGNSPATSGIRLDDGTDEWNIYIKGNNEHDIAFSYNGVIKAEIEEGSGNYVVGSDRRLKTDIKPVDHVLSKLIELRPKTYFYKGTDKKQRSLGFIAQEVEEIFPDLVHSLGEHKALAYDDFAILAVRAIQEQQELIHDLTAKVDAMSDQLTRLNELEKELDKLSKLIVKKSEE